MVTGRNNVRLKRLELLITGNVGVLLCGILAEK